VKKKPILVDFYEKFKSFSEKTMAYENKLVKKEEKKSIKLPIIKLFTGTFKNTIDNFFHFTKIAFVYSIIVTILHHLLETGFACMYKNTFNNFDMKCDIEGIPAIFYVIFHVIIFSLFAIAWQKFISDTNNKKIVLKELFAFDKTLAKFILVCIISVLLLLIPVLSLYLLYTSNPNPDYRLELGYFAVVASGFIVPFILIRFTSIFSKIITDGKIERLKAIWKKTQGNVLKLFFILLLIFLIIISINAELNIMLRPNFVKYPEATGIIGDLINNMFICFYISIFMNFSNTQRELLSKGANDNE